MVRGSDQAQPTHTDMPAFPNLRHDRLKTAQLMQFIERTTQRFPVETQQCCEFFIGQQRMFQQQAQDVPVAAVQAQSQWVCLQPLTARERTYAPLMPLPLSVFERSAPHGEELPGPRNPFEFMLPTPFELDARSGNEVLDGGRDQHFTGTSQS